MHHNSIQQSIKGFSALSMWAIDDYQVMMSNMIHSILSFFPKVQKQCYLSLTLIIIDECRYLHVKGQLNHMRGTIGNINNHIQLMLNRKLPQDLGGGLQSIEEVYG